MVKKKRVKSKAARATAARRAEREAATRASPDEEGPQRVEFKGGGGLISGMRTGFQSAVGQGEVKKKGGWLNTIIWVAVLAAAAFFFLGQFR